MKRSLLELYALLACFVSLIFLAIYVGTAVWESVGVALPSVTMDAQTYVMYQHDNVYQNHLISDHSHPVDKDHPYQAPSGEELTKARLTAFGENLEEERQKNLRALIQDLIGIAIGACIFVFHWKVAARARAGS